MVTLLSLMLLSYSIEAHSGPMLIFKAGKRHGGGGGLATLLAAGAVAKLLQGGGGSTLFIYYCIYWKKYLKYFKLSYTCFIYYLTLLYY